MKGHMSVNVNIMKTETSTQLKNMLAIKDLVFSKNQFVPAEHREVTLMEFKTSVNDAGSIVGKPGQRSEKITPFKV